MFLKRQSKFNIEWKKSPNVYFNYVGKVDDIIIKVQNNSVTQGVYVVYSVGSYEKREYYFGSPKKIYNDIYKEVGKLRKTHSSKAPKFEKRKRAIKELEQLFEINED